jgi:hypothetical protein
LAPDVAALNDVFLRRKTVLLQADVRLSGGDDLRYFSLKQ